MVHKAVLLSHWASEGLRGSRTSYKFPPLGSLVLGPPSGGIGKERKGLWEAVVSFMLVPAVVLVG